MPTLREQEGGSSGEKWNKAIGPFYSSKGVLRRMGIDQEALTEMTHTGRILALSTVDGDIVYPAGQFFSTGDESVLVNPALPRALQLLMRHEEDFADVHPLRTDDGIALIDGWTIAGALLQRNNEGRTLLEDLQQNMENPEHESWQRLLDLDGIVSGIRSVLDKPEE